MKSRYYGGYTLHELKEMHVQEKFITGVAVDVEKKLGEGALLTLITIIDNMFYNDCSTIRHNHLAEVRGVSLEQIVEEVDGLCAYFVGDKPLLRREFYKDYPPLFFVNGICYYSYQNNQPADYMEEVCRELLGDA
jgi:hypothetical protein